MPAVKILSLEEALKEIAKHQIENVGMFLAGELKVEDFVKWMYQRGYKFYGTMR